MQVLQLPTLILNRLWIPISVICVQEALKMLFGGLDTPKAKALDHETWMLHEWETWKDLKPINNLVIHGGCGQEFRVPEVVITVKFQALPTNKINCTKRNILKRDQNICQYCCAHPANSIDHIYPKSKGGKLDWFNCVAACVDCNQRKKDKSLEEMDMKLIRQPYRPRLELLGLPNNRPDSWDHFLKK